VPLRVLWRRARLFAGVGLSVGMVAFLIGVLALGWQPSQRAFPHQGLDVTERNGPIEWFGLKARSGIGFAYARATIGAKGKDARFPDYWRGMYEAGVPRGAIHLFSLCQLAADQAGNFVSSVPGTPDQLPMALDLDLRSDCPARPDRGVVLGEIRHFLQAVEAEAGKPAILKVSPAFEARYRVSEEIPRELWSVQSFIVPAYFDRPWTMWQASAYRRLDGVDGLVHWDVRAK
jgi:lysozyme